MMKLSKSLIMFLTLMALLATGSNAWADKTYRVVTIYFAGSLCDINMWDGDYLADMRDNDEKQMEYWFAKPELVSTLFRTQKALNNQTGGTNYSEQDSTTLLVEPSVRLIHHKYFVNGIEGWLDVEAAFPCDAFGRNHYYAKEFLKEVSDPYDDDIILNLIGFSRGGISALKLADYVSENQNEFSHQIKKINLLVFDPVPGFNPVLTAFNFCLESTDLHQEDFISTSDLIGDAVIFYSDDERTQLFAPVFPEFNSVLAYRVPGSHETMIGNSRAQGHGAATEKPWFGYYRAEWVCTLFPPWCGLEPVWDYDAWSNPNKPSPTLSSFSDLMALSSLYLLTSPEWGRASFDVTKVWKDGDIDPFVRNYSTGERTLGDYDKSYDFVYPFTISHSNIISSENDINSNGINWSDWDNLYNLALVYEYEVYDWMRDVNFLFAGAFFERSEERRCFVPVAGQSPPYNYTQEHITDSGKASTLDNFKNDYQTKIKDDVPFAEAGPNKTVLLDGVKTHVTFDGSGSYDVETGDSTNLYFVWKNCNLDGVLSEGMNNFEPVIPIEGLGASSSVEICLDVTNGVHVARDTMHISLVPDTDGDEVPDSADNCPTVPNATQDDTDGDGAGDLCDECPGNPNLVAYERFYQDSDGDGFGDNNSPLALCEAVVGYVENNADCDDSSPLSHPGAAETCDLLDNDCDGEKDEGFDGDGDGYTSCNGDCVDTDSTINPDATEVCDGTDNNCNNLTDEAGYVFGGFQRPINADGSSIFKAGRTIPVKLVLSECSGISASNAQLNISLKKVSSAVLGTEEFLDIDIFGEESVGAFFRYNSTDEQYIYNLSTKGLSTGTYQTSVYSDNADTYNVNFSLK